MISIDIILPFYNGSIYIKEQLESISLNQTKAKQVRLIIINDCSREEETKFLKSILPDSHLYIENEKNVGVIKSIEKGLLASTADFVMLCDQDDVWLPHKIERTVSELINSSEVPCLTFTDLKIVDENLNVISPSMFKRFSYKPSKIRNRILIQNMVTGCTVGMNRKLVNIALPFPEKILIHDHWLAICATYSGVIVAIPEVTILYRQHGRNLIGANYESFWSKLFKLRSKLERKHQHHILKSAQALDLAKRLRERNILESVGTLEEVAISLKADRFHDVINLLREKVITLTSFRELAIIIFFITVSSYKKIRRL